MTAGAADSGGRIPVDVTATNHGSDTADFTVAVDFQDASGNLLDATVASVDQVGAGQSKTVTVHSNRSLSGTVSVQVASALRH
ncbi:FxLYD domain-containing protein [Streptomyces sp. CB03911]|uniref:FxLYD domain-containing protein n=1 Tax=Streptomyces sp. CB03911 TaxID=1804758 RepID=UPI001A94A7A5|nr:FxLYD domain-containing protein [Streptomyces sp. CB03911]